MADDPVIFGDVPFGRTLEAGRAKGYVGTVGNGLDATEAALAAARATWPEGRADDFEHVRRRLWRDRGSGIEYRQPHGNPLLAIGGPIEPPISTFFVSDGWLVFLERATRFRARHSGWGLSALGL